MKVDIRNFWQRKYDVQKYAYIYEKRPTVNTTNKKYS